MIERGVNSRNKINSGIEALELLILQFREQNIR